jgi:hypothetical protein
MFQLRYLTIFLLVKLTGCPKKSLSYVLRDCPLKSPPLHEGVVPFWVVIGPGMSCPLIKVDFFRVHITVGSRVSSGSIVSDYGLHDRAIGVRFPAGAKDFSSSLCVQTGSGAHPASCTMGTGGKARPGRDADHSPPLVPRSWMSRSYTSSPPKRLHGV